MIYTVPLFGSTSPSEVLLPGAPALTAALAWPDDVAAVLDDLPAGAGGGAAAAALVAPVGVLPGVGLRRVGARWHYRGETAPAGRLEDLVDLVAEASRPGDRYFDLSARTPAAWVRVARSGAHWRAFGAEALTGPPYLSVCGSTDPDAVVALWRTLTARPLRAGVATVGATTYVIDGTDGVYYAAPAA